MRRTPGNDQLELPGTADAVDGVILVDLDLLPVAIDNGGRAILRELDTGDGADGALPALPAEFATALRGLTRESMETATLRIGVGEAGYNCRVFVMHPHNGALAGRMLAIYVKRDRSVTEAVRRVGRSYHLTAREQEALVGISMGLTSRQLAARMNISPNTVNAFLRLIMVKMGVTTRAGIVGKLINHKNGLQENGGGPPAGRQ
jgi:DNA-binding CsgD family transcriptional regulator